MRPSTGWVWITGSHRSGRSRATGAPMTATIATPSGAGTTTTTGGSMHTTLKSLLAVTGVALAMQAGAQVTLYSGEGFHGRQFDIDRPMGDLDRTDFNDRASSAVVQGGDWQVCEDSHFRGRCVILRPGE